MQPLWRHQLLILALGGIVLFANLGGARLWDRDEPRNAGCAAEMIGRGDWVVPWFNGELRPHKPVLVYWLMMASYALFGVNELGARFPSALLALGTALATYHVGRRLFSAGVGLWAAVILCSALMFDVVARAATPDSTLIFCCTAAILVYVLGAFPRQESGTTPISDSEAPVVTRPYFPRAWPVVALMYAMMGLATLAKGPVGFVLPTAVIGMFLLVMRLPARRPDVSLPAWRRWLAACVRPFAPRHFLATCWSMRPVTAILVIAAVALPWYVWVGIRTNGAWLEVFFLTHHLHRATQSMEGHSGPIVYYVFALMLGFLPWSLFMAPALLGTARRIRRRDPWRPGLIFAACWLGVYVGVFSLARTKLPNYITPAYPAAALLTACYVYHLSRGTALSSRRWAGFGATAMGVMGLAILVGMPVAASIFLPGKEWLGAVGLILLAGAGASWALFRRERLQAATCVYAAAALTFATVLFGFAAPEADEGRVELQLLDTIAARSPDARILTYGPLEPSWTFYAGRPIPQLRTSDPAELAAALTRTADTYLITTEERYETLRPDLPPELTVLDRRPRFLRPGQMVLVGQYGPGTWLEPRVAARPPRER